MYITPIGVEYQEINTRIEKIMGNNWIEYHVK
jgi:hypothetical protein